MTRKEDIVKSTVQINAQNTPTSFGQFEELVMSSFIN